MAFEKAKKSALNDLDRVHDEYEALYKTTTATLYELDELKDASFAVITKAETLVESIRRAPFTFNKPIKKISAQRETFEKREAIERKGRKEKMAAGAGAVAAMGAGAAIALSFKDFLNAKLFSKASGKFGKNLGLWVVLLIIAVVVGVFLFIAWACSRLKAASSAASNTGKIKKAIYKLQKQEAAASVQLQEMKLQYAIVCRKYNSLNIYADVRYSNIPKDKQTDLKTLIQDSVSLAVMINRDID